MRFTLDIPEPSHGIRVIRSIPDFRLGRIEGLNGVGKTLAIHLLELCSGRQPYLSRLHAWRTLCEYLGPAEIGIDGLRSASAASGEGAVHSLRFVFDWRERADDSVPGDIRADFFDEITLDGEVIDDMSEVRRWLSVVRIAGNQSLTDTIAGIVSDDLALINSAAELVRARERHADTTIGAMLAPFSVEDAQRALASSEALSALTKERARLTEEREQAADRLARLERAEETQAALGEVSSGAAVLKAEIESLVRQLEEAQRRAEQTEAELEEAHQKARLSDEAAEQLKSAESLFDKRLKSLKRLEGTLEKKVSSVSIAPEAESIEEARERAKTARAKIASDQADLKDLFALRDLLDGLISALAPAASSGLRGRAVASIGDESLTVGDLLDAVRGRRTRLEADAPAVEELDRRAAALEAESRVLDELAELSKKRDRKREELREAESALEGLSPPDVGSDSIAEKSAARAAAQRVEMELAAALGAAQRQLSQLGGGVSVEDLKAELARHLGEADTSRERLADDLRAARRNLVAIDDQLDAATARGEELASQVQAAKRLLSDQTRALRVSDEHARLRRVLGERLPDPDLDCEELARAWMDIHSAGDDSVRRFQSARTELDRLSTLISELVRSVEDGRRPPAGLDGVRRLYQDRMLEQFSQPELLSALFDSGTLTRVDLAEGEIVWQTAGGEPRVRPFEAFSSGERAFAYVQAQLASIADLGSANKLVVVDEFGAFLSRDRLTRLQEVVERQLADGAVNQALVILPMSREEDIAASGDEGYIAGDFSELTAV